MILIPADTATGEHRLRLEAENEAGEAVTMWLSLTVGGPAVALPATGTGRSVAMLSWWTLAMGAGCLLVVSVGRRRHRALR